MLRRFHGTCIGISFASLCLFYLMVFLPGPGSLPSITAPGVTPGAPTPAAEALEDLGDRLLRVFHYNNDTKQWAFYDPELEDLNTLSFMVAGETYLVLVVETTEAVLNGTLRNVTWFEGNCWNQIVW